MSTFNITLPPGVQASIQNVLDSIMNNIEGRSCTLFFPPTPIPISGNQSMGTPIGTDISSNVWSAGMPLPINSQQSFGTYAGGNNIAQIEQTGSITMVIYPNPNKFNDVFPIGERHEEGLIITRGYASDLQKVLNCTRMQTFIEVGMDHYQYKLAGEPVFMGTLIPSRYFYALWEQL